MNFVDSHCHPHFDDFYPDTSAILQRAMDAGVTKMVAVGTTLADSKKAVEFAESHDNIWATAGVHPHDAEELNGQMEAELLNMLSSSNKIVAVGEIGLDYFKNYSPREIQQKALHCQIKIGLKIGLPIVFHVRDAWDDFWPIFDSYNGITGVIHSFSAQIEQLEQALSRNLYIGLNGIMTFTKDDKQLEAAKQVPLDKLLLETDAPFLAPKPHRGKTCEPKHVIVTAEFLANLRGEKLEDIANATTKNANKLYKLESK